MISCIISTYKREPDILKRAIASIQAQTYQDIEIIIVNDAPEQLELEAQIKKMVDGLADARIRYIVHDKNKGACAARNTGAAEASGDFLAFLDDDDEWLPEKLEEQLKLMSTEDVGLVNCDSYIVNAEGRRFLYKRSWPKHFATEVEDLLEGNFVGGVSYPLLRKSTFFEAGQFDVEMRASQDTDMWIRMLKISKLAYCEKPLLNYYVMAESIETNMTSKIKGYERLLSKYEEDYKRMPLLYSKKLARIGYVFTIYSDRETASRYFKKARENGASRFDVWKNYMKGVLIRLRRKLLHH